MSEIPIKYSNYRDFLKKWVKSLPNSGRGELAKVARHLGVNSTLISQIMSGTRELSNEQALTLGSYIGLNKLNLEYFLLLVQIERAGTQLLKNHLQEKLIEIQNESKKLSNRVKHEKTFTEEEKSVFYSSWLYSSIHLYTSTEKFGVTAESIAQKFQLSRLKVSEIMSFLVDTKLCKMLNDKYIMGTQSTFVPYGSPHLTRHHLNWRLKAMQKAESINDNELMYTAQFSLSKSDINKIRELALEFISKTKEVVVPSEAEEIINLNIDLFHIK